MRMFGPEPLFRDRRDSGRALAARLERYRGRARTLTAKSLSKILDRGVLDGRRLRDSGIGDQDVQPVADHSADLLSELVRPVRRRKIRGTFRHLPVDRTITASRSLE
jgi:hypothetical protein